MGSREGEECSIQMEGYYENILPVAEATGRLQPPEQSSTSGKYLVFYRGSHKKSVIIVFAGGLRSLGGGEPDCCGGAPET